MRSSSQSTIQSVIYQVANNDPSMTKLDLTQVGEVSLDDGRDFVEALKKNETLTDLIVGKLSPYRTKECLAVLKGKKQLVKLTVSLGFEDYHVDIQDVANILSDERAVLKELILINGRLGNNEFEKLTAAVSANLTLERFGFYNVIFSSGFMPYLTKALTKNQRIVNLRFEICSMAEVDATELAGLVRAKTGITHLALIYAGIHDAQGKMLADALVENVTLKSLDLSFNEIGLIGAHALKKVMQQRERDTLSFTMTFHGNPESGVKAFNAAVTSAVLWYPVYQAPIYQTPKHDTGGDVNELTRIVI